MRHRKNADNGKQYVYDGTGQKGLLSSQENGNGYSISYSYNGLNQKTGVTYADSTTESWGYDATGNITSHEDGNSHTVNYAFDHAGELTTVTYPDTTTVSYAYDSGGRKTSMTDSTGTTGYSYDAGNRVTEISQPNGNVSYGYDNANRRTSMTMGASTTWSYSFDSGNRLTSTTNPYSETTSSGYDAANRVTSVTNGDSTVANYSYDTANRVTEIQTLNSSSAVLSDYQYTYDHVDVATQTDTDGTVTSYGYDDSDQLTSEDRDNSHSTGYSIAYTYDHNGNRATKTLNSVTDTYSYDHADKLTGITGSVSKTYGYDSNGNCTSVEVGMATTTLSYDYENRVTEITYPSSATNSFSYNGNDLRIQKVDSVGTKNYITDGDTPASAVLSDGAATYTPGLSERRSSTSKFYHGDALGSNRAITNSSQSVTDTTLFDGFGMTVSHSGSTPTPFGYVGGSQYQQDSDSGLMLLGHRYYDCSIGRFISRDPAHAGTNWYAYASNNPLGKTDPAGLEDYWHQFGNFLLGEGRAVATMLWSGTLAAPFLPNPFEPPSIGSGGNKSQNDGYEFGTGLLKLAQVALALVDGGGGSAEEPGTPGAISKPAVPVLEGGKSLANTGRDIIQWGTGPGGAIQRSSEITPGVVQGMINNGLTKGDVGIIRKFYDGIWDYLQKTGKAGDIDTPVQRSKLMDTIDKNWPQVF